MKKIISVTLVLATVSAMTAGCLGTPANNSAPTLDSASAMAKTAAAVPAANSITLKFAHFSNESHPIHTGAVQFAENVFERTNGEVSVEIYPNKELGSPMELLEQVSLGSINLSVATLSDLGRYSNRFYAVQTPFIFESYDHAHAVLDSPDFEEWVQSDLADNNFLNLGFWEYGFRNTTTKGIEINSPADLKGAKIRVPKVAQLEECFAALGSITEKIDYNELYLAMKQGVADGQENPIGVIKADKLYEVQDQLAITNHMYESVMLVMNDGAMEKLTEDQKAIVTEEARICGDLVRDLIINSENSDIEALKEFGMNVTYPNNEAFKSMMAPAYANIAKVCGQEHIDKIMELANQVK